MRPSGRDPDQMRAVTIERNVAQKAEGSCLVSFGNTKVFVTASVETTPAELAPRFRASAGSPPNTACCRAPPVSRTRREAAAGKQSGRTQEIQRLIGRSLRAVVDMQALGENQITLDCDVLEADGGTRTASITGAYIALYDAIAVAEGAHADQGRAAARFGRRHLLRHLSRHPGARSRLSRGRRGAHRRQFRAHRLGQVRRDPGHRRAGAVLARRAQRADGAGRKRHRRSSPRCRRPAAQWRKSSTAARSAARRC